MLNVAVVFIVAIGVVAFVVVFCSSLLLFSMSSHRRDFVIVLWPQQQLQRLGALQQRSVASEAAVAASGSVAGAFGCLKAPGAASGSVAGAFCGLRSSSCSVQERCRSVLWSQKQQLQRPGALQERSVASEAAVAASGSVAGAFCLWPQKQQLQHLGALQERSVASEAAIAASGSVAGAFCGLRNTS